MQMNKTYTNSSMLRTVLSKSPPDANKQSMLAVSMIEASQRECAPVLGIKRHDANY